MVHGVPQGIEIVPHPGGAALRVVELEQGAAKLDNTVVSKTNSGTIRVLKKLIDRAGAK